MVLISYEFSQTKTPRGRGGENWHHKPLDTVYKLCYNEHDIEIYEEARWQT